ncbi:hypothetical protein ACFY0G_02030 [Streptomyces sp. NPDC001552]|uniref:hypothetical protein n=1 Tax=Streptomyces sp. NPDC001552 TaxID=3364587 RepID=UPI0036C661C0
MTNGLPPTIPGGPAALDAVRYFHGGVPGLRPGDLLEPHPPAVLDGCPICEAKAAGRQPYVEGVGIVDPLPERPDRVYITTDRDYARYYASLYAGRGDLYVVEPVGAVDPSTEDRFPTWAAEAARVRSVYDRAVQLTPAQRRSLLRRWTVADFTVDPADERRSLLRPGIAAAMRWNAVVGRAGR